ncbi:MAG: Bifunctional enzyme CysN/CysC [bacterium]|nr:Bifunctional enzyme CysN/CysC [bacterium]
MTVATPVLEERMNLVVVGHVDHGKSTVIGRLLADTGSLPQGKLAQVKAMCERNARPFEYAFLLDALKNEQAQGITIDTARCFFKTRKRHYIINDAPGHVEFLKNMITGAARAEAALLVIDAHEGIQENSKRHGYMVSMVGIKQLVVLVNKMDLVQYNREVFERTAEEYTTFLENLGVHPLRFIPVAAREGDNIATRSRNMDWYDGPTVLEQIDSFEKAEEDFELSFRMPVQDIYKFTAENDDRRIVAGTVESGRVRVGDEVVFHPSGKRSTIRTIEGFMIEPRDEVRPGEATGFTLSTEIYIKAGELMCKAGDPPPHVGRRLRANLFWMGRAPMIKGKQYILRIGAMKVGAVLAEIQRVLDASELRTEEHKQQIDRHDVGEVVLETLRPVAFDRRNDNEPTGRFVIVDDYEIAGAGIVLEPATDRNSVIDNEIREREYSWEKGDVAPIERERRFSHAGKFILFNGSPGSGKRALAKQVERVLFERGCNTYYFGIANHFEDLDSEGGAGALTHDQHIDMLGKLTRILTDAGLLIITTIANIDDFDLEKLRKLNHPNEVFLVNIGETGLSKVWADVQLDPQPDIPSAVRRVVEALTSQHVLVDYSI